MDCRTIRIAICATIVIPESMQTLFISISQAGKKKGPGSKYGPWSLLDWDSPRLLQTPNVSLVEEFVVHATLSYCLTLPLLIISPVPMPLPPSPWILSCLILPLALKSLPILCTAWHYLFAHILTSNLLFLYSSSITEL